MIALPVAGRELRVASRKASTFWLRLLAALVAIVIGAGFFALASQGSFGVGPSGLGRMLFAVLTWLCLAVALSAGLFLTSDCLSEEKREGTLGLLFLTDLRGYDVVSGKLMASSLRGFYALLALLPVLGVPLLMGGVSGPQFWKTCLALVNALLVSLAAGLFVSSISRDSQKALAGTVCIVLLLVGVGPAADAIAAESKDAPFKPWASVSSPGYCFAAASAWTQSPFWWALAVNQVIALTLFLLSCLFIPRTWQDREKTSGPGHNWKYRWRFGSRKARLAARRKMLDVNPVMWLAGRERWQTVALWAIVIIPTCGLVATFVSNEPEPFWFLGSRLVGLFTLALYLGVASHASRLFVDARRSGLLDLILASPVTSHEIVHGQWRGLLRKFSAPLALFAFVLCIGALLENRAWRGMAAAATATTTATVTPPLTNATATNAAPVTSPAPTITVTYDADAIQNSMALAIAVAKALTILANFIALIWFGMWMGLTTKTGNLATLKTLLFVQVIPWFVISFASMMAVPLLVLPQILGVGSPSTRFFLWFPLVTAGLGCSLSLLKDLGFVLWSRKKLYSDFRERALAAAPHRVVLPPPLPVGPLIANKFE